MHLTIAKRNALPLSKCVFLDCKIYTECFLHSKRTIMLLCLKSHGALNNNQ